MPDHVNGRLRLFKYDIPEQRFKFFFVVGLAVEKNDFVPYGAKPFNVDLNRRAGFATDYFLIREHETDWLATKKRSESRFPSARKDKSTRARIHQHSAVD